MLSDHASVADRTKSPSVLNGQYSHSSFGEQPLVRTERRPGHQRRYAPKTRTGCITCKIRRVKCDEDKPFCKRCTTTGRKCDGYAAPGSLAKVRTPEPIGVALVNDVTSDALERRTFDYFRSRTAPCVAGYFQDSIWERMVLQLSHSEPTVRHAVNALGALHEERSLRKSAVEEGVDVSLLQTGFPLVQYHKALVGMQSLLKAGPAPLDVVLLCSLICVHFEALRESFVPALMHVENAIQMLQKSTDYDARKVNPGLVRAMMRMDLQGTMYLGSRVPELPFFTAAIDSVLPNSFHELTHARDIVNTWTARLFHFIRTTADDFKLRNPGDVPIEAFARSQELEQTFYELDRLLWEFMHKPTAKLTMREQHGLGMLRGRVKINRILAATCCYSEATVYDRFVDVFDEILTICLFIIGNDNADRQLFSASLDEGLIHPLFLLCTHCREGRIRHQALKLLENLPARDGVWHVETTKRTAAMCIRFEEALCEKEVPSCSDIPEWRRIHSAGFDGWDNGESKDGLPRKVKVHLRTRPNGMDGEWQDFEEEYGWSVPSRRFEDSFGLLMSAQLHDLSISAGSERSNGIEATSVFPAPRISQAVSYATRFVQEAKGTLKICNVGEPGKRLSQLI